MTSHGPARYLGCLACAVVLWAAGCQPAGVRKGTEYNAYQSDGASRATQQGLLKRLESADGFFVSVPLDLEFSGTSDLMRLLSSHRVVCADLVAMDTVVHLLAPPRGMPLDTASWYSLEPVNGPTPVSAGALTWSRYDGKKVGVLICTVQQLRWLIWAKDNWSKPDMDWNSGLAHYGMAVLSYLRRQDLAMEPNPPPDPARFDLPDSIDFYREPPDYVIQGYAAYKAYLLAHAAMGHDFADGATEVWATDSLLDALKNQTEPVLYPNKEAAGLQTELREFFDRGGTMRALKTLDTALFAGLEPGEYFYGVNATGQIRIGRELPREELDRIEAETGHKAPRANHAFLFPGEPLLTAGAFWIESDSTAHLVAANAGSGHYFYSNIQPTIREDIAERSDDYLLSIGHLFRALDSLGLTYDSVLISKF
jgi:hypothetical protein